MGIWSISFLRLVNHRESQTALRAIFEVSSRAVLQRRWILTAILASLLLFLKFGLSRIPNFYYAITLLSVSPRGAETRPYLRGSWLGPALAHAVGVVSDQSLFIAYCSLTILVVMLCAKTLGSNGCGLGHSVGYLLSMPFLPPLFYWVGYDSLAILLLIAAYQSRKSRTLLLMLAILAGMQHAEISIVASLQALLFEANRENFSRLWKSWQSTLIAGAILGRLSLEVILARLNSSVGSRLGEALDVLRVNFAEWRVECSVAEPLRCIPATLPVLLLSIVWTMFPWIFIFRSPWSGKLKRLLIATMAAAVLAIPVLDQTRIAVLSLTFVALMFYEANSSTFEHRSYTNILISSWVAVSLFVPTPWVWEGEVRWYGVAQGVKTVVGLI